MAALTGVRTIIKIRKWSINALLWWANCTEPVLLMADEVWY